MMKKHHYVATGIILMLLLPTLATTILTVKAYDYGHGYASNLYTTNWIQYADHAEQVWTAFTQIANLFEQAGTAYYWFEEYQAWVPCGPAYGEVNNWGHTANQGAVYGQITHDNSEHSVFSTALYVGHGGTLGFYGHSNDPNNPNNPPNPYASFEDIRSLMTSQSSAAFQFVLMWVCLGINTFPAGSSTAWNPLWWSNPPSYPPYTWVGFEDFSPWLYEGMGTYGPYGQENIYRYWLVFFYYYALSGNSIMTALNYASAATGFGSFGSSILGVGYESYWPYHMSIQGVEFHPGYYPGRMAVAGNPLGTYLPTEFYME